jgi:hypothetical protein
MNLAKAVLQLKNEREQARRKLEQLDSALSALAGLDGPSGKTGRAQTLGEMEGCKAKQIRATTAMVPRTDVASRSSGGLTRRLWSFSRPCWCR